MTVEARLHLESGVCIAAEQCPIDNMMFRYKTTLTLWVRSRSNHGLVRVLLVFSIYLFVQTVTLTSCVLGRLSEKNIFDPKVIR